MKCFQDALMHILCIELVVNLKQKHEGVRETENVLPVGLMEAYGNVRCA